MIHGILYKDNQPILYRKTAEENHSDLILSSLYHEISSVSYPHCWLAQSVEKQLGTNRNKQLASIGTPPRAVITAWAHLDNREELAQWLNITPQNLKILSSAELILRAYLHFGTTCTKHLLGDFCFAIYDILENRLFCARDHMGIKPFYYYNDNNVFVFSSSLTLFHRLTNIVVVKPRMMWVSQFLLNSSFAMDFEKTAYQNIFKLPPAHQLQVTLNSLTKESYFSFHTNKIQLRSSSEYVEYYREHLNKAIKRRAQVEHPLGSELSGGLDSSSVTALAVKHFPLGLENFHTFGFAYHEDEPGDILCVSQHCQIPMTNICCNISLFKNDPMRALQALGAPAQHRSALLSEVFYDRASYLGIKTLLSGFGGDEFVSSTHSHLFLYELLKNKKYFELYQNLPGNPAIRTLHLLKFLHNRSNRHETLMAQTYAKRWPLHVVADELVQTYKLKDLYDQEATFNYGYHNLDQFILEKRLAPYVSTRTEECTLMAATYGINYRWPLLDVELIQCFLSIPSNEKYHRGTGRYLHKRAIADIVPKKIIARKTKFLGKRIAQYIPRQYRLNQDLHPILFSFINKRKLFEQDKQLAHMVENDRMQLNSWQWVTVQHSIERVNQLDNWLKYYFANGCEWGDMV